MSLEKKIVKPHSTLIEQTAADLCATYYEVGRSQGLTSKHKTHKAFVHHNIEHFIPIAVDILTTMLGNPNTPDNQKEAIAEALLERANDPDLSFMNEKIEWKDKVILPEVIRPFDRAFNKAKKDILK